MRSMHFVNYSYLDVQCLAEGTIRIETATTLLLRKILDPAKPAHQAILDQSAALEEPTEGIGHSSAVLPVASANANRAEGNQRNMNVANIVSVRRSVKRLHQDESLGSLQITQVGTLQSAKRARAMMQPTSDFIDLTQS